ncbi:hypothetical protein AAXB25_22825 [Paenibacillus lautus]|uniref:hypothetical protein n=1 Tax=Paenibacillus lautus TaxID=1401 RepID=UPI003D29B61F
MSKKKILKRSERTYPGLDPTISLDYPKVDMEKLRKEYPIRNNIRTVSNEKQVRKEIQVRKSDDQDKEVNDHLMDIAVFGAPLGIFKKKM